MTNTRLACIFYAQFDQGVRLLPFQYQSEQYWICPAHLPILIHKPDQLAGKLTGLEQPFPSEGQV